MGVEGKKQGKINKYHNIIFIYSLSFFFSFFRLLQCFALTMFVARANREIRNTKSRLKKREKKKMFYGNNNAFV